jgi:hypothetical protein
MGLTADFGVICQSSQSIHRTLNKITVAKRRQKRSDPKLFGGLDTADSSIFSGKAASKCPFQSPNHTGPHRERGLGVFPLRMVFLDIEIEFGGFAPAWPARCVWGDAAAHKPQFFGFPANSGPRRFASPVRFTRFVLDRIQNPAYKEPARFEGMGVCPLRTPSGCQQIVVPALEKSATGRKPKFSFFWD